MAFSTVGHLLSQNTSAIDVWNAAAETSNLTSGRLGVVNICWTHASISTIDGVADAAGNTWIFARRWSAGSVYHEIWYTVATGTLSSGQFLTVTWSGAVNGGSVVGHVFGLAGTGVTVDSTNTGNDASIPPLVAISSLSNLERLWFRGDVIEGTVTYTPDASYTVLDSAGATTSGVSPVEVAARGEFQIITTTGQSTQPTRASGSTDCSGILVAFSELMSGGGAEVHYLPSDKTAYVLTNGKTLAGAAADIQTIAIPIGSHHAGILHTSMAMSAGPATPALAQVQLSKNGSDWYTYKTLHGPRTAITQTFSTKIPQGTHWVRLNISSANTGTLTISSYYDFVAGVT